MGLYDRDYGRSLERTPWDRVEKPRSVTIMLIVINVVVFFIDFLFAKQGSSQLTPWFAAQASTLTQPWMWWQFLTYGFLHDINNLNHVLFNMIGLFFFGRIVERRLGPQEFLKFYLGAVIAGGIVASISYWFQGGGAVIGASGAVVATTILFACYYPHEEVLLMLVIPVKAWILAVGFVAMDFAGALGLMGRATTAFEVHLTGAVFAASYFYQRWNFRWLDLSTLTDLPKYLSQRSRRMKLKIHDPDRKLRQDADEADRILAKIHSHGESSLTRAERKILERYSRRQREKRDR
ncbi:Rhomboid protease GluP [Novipirellula galeiformis]|uniref:Rhomboid protease GluP n=1 Tax=Novipirellula galeiformis TaxID=2528004 RepID=A0A5C6CF13_9BACT|nr:rhomboid family intramembrane serine protease [Novipirellula galeiformis]TWU23483.1 Rhomboid protease GluP [Novipirellula galeiformis]